MVFCLWKCKCRICGLQMWNPYEISVLYCCVWDHPVTKDSGARCRKKTSWILDLNTKAAVSSVNVHHFVMYFNIMWSHVIRKYYLCARGQQALWSKAGNMKMAICEIQIFVKLHIKWCNYFLMKGGIHRGWLLSNSHGNKVCMCHFEITTLQKTPVCTQTNHRIFLNEQITF